MNASTSKRWPELWAALLTLSASLLAFRVVHGLSFLGFDAYPSIAASRITSWSDFVGTFSERLMHHWFPLGDFYRPVTNLSVALDHALWGLDPGGYHATNVLLFGFSAWSLFWFARSIAPKARYAPFVVLLVYLVHPLHLHVYPVLARRADMLCGAFIALSLALGLRRITPLRSLAIFVLSVLAIGSKVSGIIVVPLAFVLVRSQGATTLKALRATAPYLAAFLVVIAARIGVLGGIGGYRVPGAHSVWEVPFHALAVLFDPPSAALGWLSATALLVMMISFVVIALLPERRSLLKQKWSDPMTLMFVGLCWLVFSSALLLGSKGRLHWWYSFMPLLGLCLVLGGMAEDLFKVASRAGKARRIAILGCAALIVGWGTFLTHSPLVRQYPELRIGAQEQRVFLSEVASDLSSAEAGVRLTAPPIPNWLPMRSSQEHSISLLAPYSVQAWADIVFAQKGVQVVFLKRGAEPQVQPRSPAPSQVTLLIAQVRRAATR